VKDTSLLDQANLSTDMTYLKKDIGEIKESVKEIRTLFSQHQVQDASLRMQIKVLWAAAGIYAVTLLGLAVRVLVNH